MSAFDLYCPKCKIVLNGNSGYKKCMICGSKLLTVANTDVKLECPTCHSNKVIPVSQTRRSLNRWAFGINNPTARAQFECKNCGYKW